MTLRTVLQLAGEPVPDEPERADWINPPELDAPAARILVDRGRRPSCARQAAAELLAAPSYVVYRVDMVNAPIALGSRSSSAARSAMRAIGYDKRGTPTCVHVFIVQNDKAKSEWAMDQSDKALDRSRGRQGAAR